MTPLPLDLGRITDVPFSAQSVSWSSFDWNVVSSWKRTTVLSMITGSGEERLAGSAAFASSVGALLGFKKKSPCDVRIWSNTEQHLHVHVHQRLFPPWIQH